MTMTAFSFQSHGTAIAGHLFAPNTRPKGLVITTGPLTSVKEQASGAYARAMADRGYAALAFDHRTFGESAGQPRQLENPVAKAQDLQAAVTALVAVPALATLPVLGLGVCAGAGYMAAAVAGDHRFSAFAGVAGVYPSLAQTQAWMGQGYDTAIARAQAAREKFESTGIAETIPAVAEDLGDVAMPLREAYDYYGTPRGAVPNYVNGFAVQSRLYTLPFDAQVLAPQIKVPTLIVHSEKALMPALARDFYARLTVPKRELWLASQGQIDFYDDPALINPAADAIDAFFAQAAS